MKHRQLIIQFMKFGAVGVANTIISIMVYYLLLFLEVNYIIANTAGFVFGVINAYYLNKKYVFINAVVKSKLPFIKVFVSYGSTFILSTVLLYIMVDILQISSLLAPIINLIITVPLNFMLNKFWAFK